MKKDRRPVIWFVSSILLGVLLLQPATAHADDSVAGVPTTIIVTPGGAHGGGLPAGVAFQFASGAHATCGSKYVLLPQTHTFFREILSILIAAKNSNTVVSCNVPSKTADCSVYYCQWN